MSACLRVLCACLLLAPLARAEDSIVVVHQGRLLDAGDAPVSGEMSFTFRIYPVASDPNPSAPVSPLWTGTFSGVSLSKEGTYSVLLGSGAGQPLPSSIFHDGAARWLGVTVGTAGELQPRMRIGSVPVAAFASQAARATLAETAETALDARKLGGLSPEHFTNAANLGGSLGSAVKYEGAPIADAHLEGASRWNANLSSVALAAGTPLSGKGSAAEPLSIASASGARDGYLKGADYARFESKVSSVTAGTGLVATGSATAPTLNVAYGNSAGTAAAGNDPRLSDARAPSAGSSHYIQNRAVGSAPQDAHLSVKSAAFSDSLSLGGVDVMDAFPFYRMTVNQILSGTGNSINNWNVNTAAGASVTYQFTVRSDVVWESRTAAERELLTAMGRTGARHLRHPINVYRVSWTNESVWLVFPNQVPTLPQYTAAAFTKLESGAVDGFWATGAQTGRWKLTGSNMTGHAEGYTHPHPYSQSPTGSMLVAMPAVVAGRVDLSKPINWSWFPYVDPDSTK